MNDRRRSDYTDGRNPYGSRGGYVTSGRDNRYYDDRNMNDRARGDRGWDDERSYDRGYHDMRDYNDYGYEDRYNGRNNNYGRDNDYRDGRRMYATVDYDAHGKGRLSNKELHKWEEELTRRFSPDENQMFDYDTVIKSAESMQVPFEHFSKEELYATTLMMYSDYKTTIGQNPNMYIALAVDFLTDDDAKVRYGEKLACYFDCFANV